MCIRSRKYRAVMGISLSSSTEIGRDVVDRIGIPVKLSLGSAAAAEVTIITL